MFTLTALLRSTGCSEGLAGLLALRTWIFMLVPPVLPELSLTFEYGLVLQWVRLFSLLFVLFLN